MGVNIVLFQPEIPQNTGNIARSCAATNTPLHLIKPLGFSIDDKHVKRAGLDYWSLLDLYVYEDLDEFLEQNNYPKIYLSSTKGGRIYSDYKFEEDSFIMFGRETKGLPKEIMDAYKSTSMRIPMAQNEKARSLNLSNSVAIVLYESLRQSGFKNLI